MLRFNHTWSDYERLQAKHMQETFRGIITRDGRHADLADAGEPIATTGWRPAARSSTRPARRAWATIRSTSVLNAHCQAHDVKNVFVADGGPFVSQADKNLTWTIMALVVAHRGVHREREE